MRASSDSVRGLQPKGRDRSLAIASCGALLLLLGACGSSTNSPDGGDEATAGSTGNGAVPQTGGADSSGGARSGGAGGIGVGAEGGATGGTVTGGATGGNSGSPTGGNGGSPTGGNGGSPTGGNGGDPTGGNGGDPTGGNGGNPTGGSGGDPTGGSGGGFTGGAGPCDDPGTTHSGGTQYCEYSTDDVGNGYYYEFWTNTSDSGCMTVFGDDATFKCDWTDAVDFLCRVGLTYDKTRTPDEIGTFSSDFAVTGSASGVAFVGIHGWTSDPLVEFYIMEDWVNEPEGSAPAYGAPRGTIAVDGGTYAVYQQHIGQSPLPTQQYFSIRTEGRQCGHISISEHFAQWVNLGLELGQLEKVMVFTEGLSRGSGDYEFTRATLTVQ